MCSGYMASARGSHDWKQGFSTTIPYIPIILLCCVYGAVLAYSSIELLSQINV